MRGFVREKGIKALNLALYVILGLLVVMIALEASGGIITNGIDSFTSFLRGLTPF